MAEKKVTLSACLDHEGRYRSRIKMLVGGGDVFLTMHVAVQTEWFELRAG